MSVEMAISQSKVDFKRHLLLRRIRRFGRIGRLELAKSLRISNSRVCELVQELLDENFLKENHTGEDRRGRRGVPVMLNSQFGRLLILRFLDPAHQVLFELDKDSSIIFCVSLKMA